MANVPTSPGMNAEGNERAGKDAMVDASSVTAGDREAPYPDHPLFNWDFQWHPTASPAYSFTEVKRSGKEQLEVKRYLARKARTTFGFAAALDQLKEEQ